MRSLLSASDWGVVAGMSDSTTLRFRHADTVERRGMFVVSDGFLNTLFDGDKPSETTQGIMKFCEEFEMGAQRTNAFMEELKKADLLIDGEVTIQLNDQSQPSTYRGFKMVNEEKFRELRGDDLRKMNQSGLLPLIIAHLFSLPLSREIYLRQVEQGKGPAPQPATKAPETAEA